jgi:hypothetical protein
MKAPSAVCANGTAWVNAQHKKAGRIITNPYTRAG